MNNKKQKIKILILCFDYPPLTSIGSQRPYAWRKHFIRFNFETILITRNWSDKIKEPKDYYKKDEGEEIDRIDQYGRIIKINYNGSIKYRLFSNNIIKKLVRKGLSLAQEFLKWRIPFFDEKYFIYKRAKKYITNNKVDLILTTGEPYILFKYAYELGIKNQIPYVLDYRDGWNTDHVKKNWIFRIINSFEKKREKKYLKNAIFATAASPKIIKDNIDIFNYDKFYLHENGIDLEFLNNAKKEICQYKKFTVCYTGSIYLEHNIDAFISAFHKLKSINEINIQFIFVGIKLKLNNQVQKLIDLSLNHQKDIIIYETIPHEDCIKLQLKSHLLLKFDFTGQKDNLLGAKLYEYSATKKPILTILSTSDKSTSFYPDKNVQIMTFKDDEIVAEIIKCYKAHKENKQILNNLSDSEIRSFSREKSIQEFSKKIQEILK